MLKQLVVLISLGAISYNNLYASEDFWVYRIFRDMRKDQQRQNDYAFVDTAHQNGLTVAKIVKQELRQKELNILKNEGSATQDQLNEYYNNIGAIKRYNKYALATSPKTISDETNGNSEYKDLVSTYMDKAKINFPVVLSDYEYENNAAAGSRLKTDEQGMIQNLQGHLLFGPNIRHPEATVAHEIGHLRNFHSIRNALLFGDANRETIPYYSKWNHYVEFEADQDLASKDPEVAKKIKTNLKDYLQTNNHPDSFSHPSDRSRYEAMKRICHLHGAEKAFYHNNLMNKGPVGVERLYNEAFDRSMSKK